MSSVPNLVSNMCRGVRKSDGIPEHEIPEQMRESSPKWGQRFPESHLVMCSVVPGQGCLMIGEFQTSRREQEIDQQCTCISGLDIPALEK
jgi:hypothetical protein